MIFNFDKKIENLLKIITKNAQNQNIRVFFVGGIVRDNLLKLDINDIDLIVEGNAINFISNIEELTIKSTHKDFGTLKISYDNIEIDIASTRIEKYPYSGCLPVVEKIGVDIKEDISRRDFSINSLYARIYLENDILKYELIDLINGINDLNSKTLKVLHKKSYIDDPTRILRGLDFSNRFNFSFSDEDKILIDECLKNIDYENISYDRTLGVLKKILKNNPLKVFKQIIKNNYNLILSPCKIETNFAKLEKLFNVFKLSNDEQIEVILDILKNKETTKEDFSNILDIYKFYKKIPTTEICYSFLKEKNENIKKYLEIKDITISTTGSDLINLGFKQGKNIGEILDNLLKYKLENKLYLEKQEEIDWIIKRYPKK